MVFVGAVFNFSVQYKHQLSLDFPEYFLLGVFSSSFFVGTIGFYQLCFVCNYNILEERAS